MSLFMISWNKYRQKKNRKTLKYTIVFEELSKQHINVTIKNNYEKTYIKLKPVRWPQNEWRQSQRKHALSNL